MKIKFSACAFILTFALHFYYTVNIARAIAEKWINVGSFNVVDSYINQQSYFIGLSYALTAAFTAYAIINFSNSRKAGAAGTLGGLTLSGILYFAACFLTGCCGSPMLAVYLSLFGSSFIGFAKPITAALTLISVTVGFAWIKRNNKKSLCCNLNNNCCDVEEIKVERIIMEKNVVSNADGIKKVYNEFAEGMGLKKCRQCGCMKETLESIEQSAANSEEKDLKGLTNFIRDWKKEITEIKYSCLGCEHCYPAVALNLLNEKYPSIENKQLGCAIETKEDKWPYVAGEYYAFCGGDYGNPSLRDCPVGVSTLGDAELADRLAKNHPKELCIVGKTETENIGIDKVIKNTVTNPTIKYLLLVGQEPKGHKSGETFLSLSKNGVDEKMRVIGSTAKKPILRNVSVEEINTFRNQVEVVNMIGCSDEKIIVDKIKELASKQHIHFSNINLIEEETSPSQRTSCGCKECEDKNVGTKVVEVIQAKEPTNIIMDKAGYFVILPIPEKNIINAEHYSYDNTLLRVIKGKDARSIYWTIIENNWVTLLSHAAYIGKELEKAELSLQNRVKYVQDGA